MKITHKVLLLVVVCFSFVFTSCSKEEFTEASPTTYQQPSLFDRWQSEEILQLTIKTDVSSLLNHKTTEHQQAATVNWMLDGTTFEMSADISPRGKTRLSLCDFPPLKLKFDKAQLEASGYAPYRSFKLVTHCNDNQQLVFKEYLTYKMYNQLTENSFQVQLAEVTYQDVSGQFDPFTQYAIVLENNQEMAHRIGGDQMKTNGDQLRAIDADQYRLLTVFQYMIGNTDWNLSKSHNIKLVQPQASPSAPVPVPYDFDHAGIVSAPYAKPHPQLPIQTVTQRLFQWRGKSAAGFEPTLEKFKTNKIALFNLCEDFPLLDEGQKTEMLNYLASFYEMLEQIDEGGDLMAVFSNERPGKDS